MSGPADPLRPRVRRAKCAPKARALPIVWGGVHPTLLPEQTAASAAVDVVVRGEGETIVGPLADRLAAGAPLDDVNGLTYKLDGAIVSTPDAELVDLDTIPVELPYDLLELDGYPTLQAGRVHLQTSRGCPGRCGFCYNTGFNSAVARQEPGARRRRDAVSAAALPAREDRRPGRRQLLRQSQTGRRDLHRAARARPQDRLARELPLRLPRRLRRRLREPAAAGRLHGARLRRRERLAAHAGASSARTSRPTRSCSRSPSCASSRRRSTRSSRGSPACRARPTPTWRRPST